MARSLVARKPLVDMFLSSLSVRRSSEIASRRSTEPAVGSDKLLCIFGFRTPILSLNLVPPDGSVLASGRNSIHRRSSIETTVCWVLRML